MDSTLNALIKGERAWHGREGREMVPDMGREWVGNVPGIGLEWVGRKLVG